MKCTRTKSAPPTTKGYNLNQKQQEGFEMNKEKREVLNMNRALTSSRVEYPEIEKDAPKNLKATDTQNDPKERFRSIYEDPGSRSEDRVDAENLEELRPRFTAEVGQSKWVYGYQGRKKKRRLFKNVRMRDSGKLLAERLWKDAGKWAHGLNDGDVIAFNATLKNGIPMNPSNVTVIKPAPRSIPTPIKGVPAVQLEMF